MLKYSNPAGFFLTLTVTNSRAFNHLKIKVHEVIYGGVKSEVYNNVYSFYCEVDVMLILCFQRQKEELMKKRLEAIKESSEYRERKSLNVYGDTVALFIESFYPLVTIKFK